MRLGGQCPLWAHPPSQDSPLADGWQALGMSRPILSTGGQSTRRLLRAIACKAAAYVGRRAGGQAEWTHGSRERTAAPTHLPLPHNTHILPYCGRTAFTHARTHKQIHMHARAFCSHSHTHTPIAAASPSPQGVTSHTPTQHQQEEAPCYSASWGVLEGRAVLHPAMPSRWPYTCTCCAVHTPTCAARDPAAHPHLDSLRVILLLVLIARLAL